MHHMKKHEGHNGEIGLSSPMSNKNHFGCGFNMDSLHGVFDIRLKENFKLSVTIFFHFVQSAAFHVFRSLMVILQ